MHKALVLLLLVCSGFSGAAMADDAGLSKGQTLYLPVYSHIWHGDRVVEGKYPLRNQLSALISIRNTSFKTPIKITSARYYSTEGKLLKEYVAEARQIAPMATMELFIEKKETAGGSGANFVIQWEAPQPSNIPVVEALHADIKGHQTLTFITVARPIIPEK